MRHSGLDCSLISKGPGGFTCPDYFILLPPAEKEHLPLLPLDLIQERFNATKNLAELDKALTHALPVLSPLAAAVEEVSDLVPRGLESLLKILIMGIGLKLCGMNKCCVGN